MRLKELASTSAQPLSEAPTLASPPKESSSIPLYTGDEDIGSAIPRTALPTHPASLTSTYILPDEPVLSPTPRAISPSLSITDVIVETDMVPSSPPSALLTPPSQPPLTNFPIEPEARTASVDAKSGIRIVPRDRPDDARVVATSTNPKKRRKVRDEIDDIFG